MVACWVSRPCCADLSARKNLATHGEDWRCKPFWAWMSISQTRCAHYHSERDIIAIKFKCAVIGFRVINVSLPRRTHRSGLAERGIRRTRGSMRKLRKQLTISDISNPNWSARIARVTSIPAAHNITILLRDVMSKVLPSA